MMDQDDLYREIIIDHSRSPRNLHGLPEETHWCAGHNPLCGDSLVVHLLVKDGFVSDASFEGAGCAISMASASMMTEAIKGKSVQEARDLVRRFRGQLLDEQGTDDDLGVLEALAGVKNYPMRVKCATLAWHTLDAALDKPGGKVTTE